MHKKKNIRQLGDASEMLTPSFARRAMEMNVPKYEMPKGEMLPETLGKNLADKDEYPQTAEIEGRCVNMIARLWNSPDDEEAVGTSTIGSSEAAMLGGMALLKRWRQRREAEGKAADRPNLVMGINVQVCWEKFCVYWDIEPRYVPMEEGRYQLGAGEAIGLCDENTIAVLTIMGSTFDGSYEPVREMGEALDRLHEEKGLDIPIHVDGASGGFIAARGAHLQGELPGRRDAHLFPEFLPAGQSGCGTVL